MVTSPVTGAVVLVTYGSTKKQWTAPKKSKKKSARAQMLKKSKEFKRSKKCTTKAHPDVVLESELMALDFKKLLKRLTAPIKEKERQIAMHIALTRTKDILEISEYYLDEWYFAKFSNTLVSNTYFAMLAYRKEVERAKKAALGEETPEQRELRLIKERYEKIDAGMGAFGHYAVCK